MMSYEFGDIVLVPFPFTNQSAIKKRPAVIVSSAQYHRNHPDIIVMAITSQMKTSGVADSLVIVDWQKAGLLKPSIIKPLVSTINQRLIHKKLGRLIASDRQALQAVLLNLFGE
jgi:mRNA interferase MazF